MYNKKKFDRKANASYIKGSPDSKYFDPNIRSP